VRLTQRLRQDDLADLLGATARSIITILNAWRAAGVVLYDTERAFVTLCDPGALRAIAQQDAIPHHRPVPARALETQASLARWLPGAMKSSARLPGRRRTLTAAFEAMSCNVAPGIRPRHAVTFQPKKPGAPKPGISSRHADRAPRRRRARASSFPS